MIDELKFVLIALGAKAARELLDDVECDTEFCEECHIEHHCRAVREIAGNYEKVLSEWQEVMDIRRSAQKEMLNNMEELARESWDSE